MGLNSSRQDSVNTFVALCSDASSAQEQICAAAAAENHVVNASSDAGQLALVAALEAGHSTAALWLISDPFGNLRINNASEVEGTSALLAACSFAPPTAAAEAAAVEMNMNGKDEYSSAGAGLLVLRALLDKWGPSKLKFDHCDSNGWSALHHCAFHGHTEAAELLLSAEAAQAQGGGGGGAAATLDHYGQSPLHVAAARGDASLGLLRLLLARCYCSVHSLSDLQWRDKDAQTAEDVAETAEAVQLLQAHALSLAARGEC